MSPKAITTPVVTCFLVAFIAAVGLTGKAPAQTVAPEEAKTAADGSVIIYIQKNSPGPDKASNWLPAPDAPFFAVQRVYGLEKPSAQQNGRRLR